MSMRTAAWAGIGLGLIVAGGISVGAGTGMGGGGELAGWGEQARRFLSLRDPAVRHALAGAVLLGISCGLLGAFLVVRKLALVGDTLSHAVLPGVAAGFLWNQTKDPWSIFVGAVAAGMLGTLTVGWIRRTTRLKEDAALGMVLAGFYAVGICLMTMIQRLPTGNKSGIDTFLFGQAAAIATDDLWLMGSVTVAAGALIALFYKELLVTSFDAAFARSAGYPAQWVHHGLMLLVSFAVVSALQAVGVVLVAAMLVTPAATAYLLTDRFHRMLGWSALLGMGAGVGGCFVSFLGGDLPTGPTIVLTASAGFAGAFLFASRHGVVPRALRQRAATRRATRENALKAAYHVLEGRGFRGATVTMRELAEQRRETLEDALARVRSLARHGLAAVEGGGERFRLTEAGMLRAAEVVRNHRLWELYLTHAAQIAPDHVHDDAEEIEHVLGEDVVRQLERRLNYAATDPHGRRIPSPEEPGAPVSAGARLKEEA